MVLLYCSAWSFSFKFGFDNSFNLFREAFSKAHIKPLSALLRFSATRFYSCTVFREAVCFNTIGSTAALLFFAPFNGMGGGWRLEAVLLVAKTLRGRKSFNTGVGLLRVRVRTRYYIVIKLRNRYVEDRRMNYRAIVEVKCCRFRLSHVFLWHHFGR